MRDHALRQRLAAAVVGCVERAIEVKTCTEQLNLDVKSFSWVARPALVSQFGRGTLDKSPVRMMVDIEEGLLVVDELVAKLCNALQQVDDFVNDELGVNVLAEVADTVNVGTAGWGN